MIRGGDCPLCACCNDGINPFRGTAHFAPLGIFKISWEHVVKWVGFIKGFSDVLVALGQLDIWGICHQIGMLFSIYSATAVILSF